NLNANADATGTAGVAFTYPIQATNPPILSYAASGLPAGLTVDIATGLISGTPTTPGTYPVALSATNASGPGHKTVTFTINPPANGLFVGLRLLDFLTPAGSPNNPRL